MERIDSFTMSAGYFWLSNFYECDIDGYTSTEAYYQSMKTTDLAIRETFKKMDPKTSKKEGRKIELRPDWDAIKDTVMLGALVIKFEDPHLADMLVATHPAILIEGNTWHDNYWGDCHCYLNEELGYGVEASHPDCLREGKNMLGHMLMAVRGFILNENVGL